MKNLFFVFLFIGFAGAANAQFTGKGSQPKTITVEEVVDKAAKLDRKDTLVELEGFILEKIDDDTYWFQDDTGKIKVEIDQRHLPTQTFNENNKIKLVGEVDYDMLEGTEIEVKQTINIL